MERMPSPVLQRLSTLAAGSELPALSARLASLAELVAVDQARVELAMPAMRSDASAVERGAHHLLARGGKRLRPMFVALASRLGTGFDDRALLLAVAVELVHNATLLHDDVVDLGDVRRGAPAARVMFGNAVSIFAGDWLLIDALRRVQRAQVPDTFERLLAVIEEMILAESIQLEQRNAPTASVARWLEVVEGKTAALFRWAMYAGGRAGGLPDEQCEALERFGRHIGVAFQAIDDVLDFSGDPNITGKHLFADLREGKLTYPILIACERDSSLRARIASGECDDAASIVERTGAIETARAFAFEHCARAKHELAPLPAGPALDALITLADAAVHRAA
jgi:octaprenyl-diphosphate synthase